MEGLPKGGAHCVRGSTQVGGPRERPRKQFRISCQQITFLIKDTEKRIILFLLLIPLSPSSLSPLISLTNI